MVRWTAKEVVRQIYDHTDPELATEGVDQISRDFTDTEMPLEVRVSAEPSSAGLLTSLPGTAHTSRTDRPKR